MKTTISLVFFLVSSESSVYKHQTPKITNLKLEPSGQQLPDDTSANLGLVVYQQTQSKKRDRKGKPIFQNIQKMSEMETDFDMSQPSMSSMGASTTQTDRDGFVVPPVKWYPRGDKRNKDILANLKSSNPKAYKRAAIAGILKRKFPYKEYGSRYFPRHTPAGIARYGANWNSADQAQRDRRNADGWYGDGMYSNAGAAGFQAGAVGNGRYGFNSLLNDIRSAGRKIIGRPILNAAQNAIIKGISGQGSYESIGDNILGTAAGNLSMNESPYSAMSYNQLINHPKPSRQIVTASDETNSIVLTHSEYIGDVVPTSSSFQSQYFLSINPGLPGTFPWLSNIAQFYEEYSFLQLVFTFKSMVTEGNASASGTVIMATQYNPANAAFSSKQSMENYDYAQSAKVTANAHHGIECDPTKHGGGAIEYVRSGAVPSGQDLKTYDLATFQLATTGAQANLNVGELWVSYKVVLRKTKILPTGPGTRVVSALAYTGTLGATTGSTVFNNVTTSTSNAPTGALVFSGSSITFKAGTLVATNYMVLIQQTTTNTVGDAAVWSITNGTIQSQGADAAADTSPSFYFAVFNINSASSDAVLTLGGLSGTHAASAGTVYIYQLSG